MSIIMLGYVLRHLGVVTNAGKQGIVAMIVKVSAPCRCVESPISILH